MDQHQATHILQTHDIKPTANRILVVRLLSLSEGPLSQGELERELVSVDKSVISRTLALFREHHLVHLIESGEGVRY
ncbi:MAG: transcriptional repressor, partial [Prevotella sp.]|nr:transcriptional repressor [Prevotella sp.]